MTRERKRGEVPFDRHFFRKRESCGLRYGRREIFTYIYENNHWSGSSSVSGNGSGSGQTATVGPAIARLVRDLGVNILLDIPCGDFGWMSSLDLPIERYIGGDIVPELVIRNRTKFGKPGREFIEIDIVSGELPRADLLLCRDCLVHLSNDDVMKALENIACADIGYILATTFTGCDHNEDITTGDWRIVNLEKRPFSLGVPVAIINEDCTEGNGTYSDKSLGLWRVSDMRRGSGRNRS